MPTSVLAIGRDGQAFHAAIGLTSGGVECRIELEPVAGAVHVAARISDQELGRNRDRGAPDALAD